MTQYQHADRRTTVLMPALVAAAVSAVITSAGVLYVAQPTTPTNPQSAPISRTAGAVAAGILWEAQRDQQSVSGLRRARAYEAMLQAGAEWQLRYEQITPKNR
jgi:hypothetical protein